MVIFIVYMHSNVHILHSLRYSGNCNVYVIHHIQSIGINSLVAATVVQDDIQCVIEISTVCLENKCCQ